MQAFFRKDIAASQTSILQFGHKKEHFGVFLYQDWARSGKTSPALNYIFRPVLL